MASGHMSRFGNNFEAEAFAGALPAGRNSPQKIDYRLCAGQLSADAAPTDSRAT